MNLLKMMRIVLWSFFGIRRAASHQADIADIKLPLLPLVAISLAGMFGVSLFALATLAIKMAH